MPNRVVLEPRAATVKVLAMRRDPLLEWKVKMDQSNQPIPSLGLFQVCTSEPYRFTPNRAFLSFLREASSTELGVGLILGSW